ncbi:MAG: alkylmercury lyase [Actinomycetota bacterium]|nr:alkylmercury lyase [Actinomycetota bacterium]
MRLESDWRTGDESEGDVAPSVEFFWWEECPSWERALADLRSAMLELELDPDSILMRRISTEAEAVAEDFPGSPTIRVNGIDVADHPDDLPRGLVCRRYLRRDRRVSPLPDPTDVREALAAAAG